MKQILLIEDENDLRELLEFNFKSHDYSIVSFGNANDALMAIEDVAFDLVLLDLMLPGLQGLNFLEIIRRNGNTVPVIITSAKNTEADIINAINKGADDYITKPYNFAFLNTKIKALFRRMETENTSTSETISSHGIEINKDAYKATIDGTAIQLTQKEFELLAMLIKNPGKVYTRNKLLNTIWGYDTDTMTRTVDSHVASLRKKLGDRGVHIVTLPKIGYSWEEY